MSEENLVTSGSEISQPEVNETQNVERSEKRFSQEDLDSVLKKRLHETKEKYERLGYDKAKAEYATQQVVSQQVTGNGQSYAGQSGNAPTNEDDKIRRIVAEQQEVMRTQGAIEHALNTFRTRVQEGFTDPEYPDYKETVACLNTEAMTPVALLASTFENTKDIMYQLGKDPSQAGVLLSLMNNPHTISHAQEMLARISRSAAESRSAKTPSEPNPPLSQVKASTTGVDSGPLTYQEVRRKPSLRV